MTPGSRRSSRSWVIQASLTVCMVAFLSFFLNVLYGRFAASLGLNPAFRLGRVPEFWLLFGSAVFFVVAALAAEQEAAGASSDSHFDRGGTHEENARQSG